MNDWENVAYWEESEQSKALANNFGLSQTQLGSLGGSRSQGNFAISPPHLETVFPALKLTQNCYIFTCAKSN